MRITHYFDGEVAMTSLDFLEHVINPARHEAGESLHEPRKFLLKVEDELDLDGTGKKFRLNGNHTESAYYDLNMEQMTLVGMRESKAVRRSVLDKLKDLSGVKPAIPQTYAAALLEAGRLAMELEQAEARLAIAAPKAEFVDRYVDAIGTYGFRQAAKILIVKENWFADFLIDKQIMYRLNKKLTAYSVHVDAGRFVSRAGVGKNDHAFTESRFTAKGLQWVSGEIAKKRTEMAIAKK